MGIKLPSLGAEMSIQYVKMAIDTKLSVALKLLLIIICEAANKDGYCWPGLRLISEKSGLCERSVQRGIAALESAGFVKRVPRHRSDGSSTSNGYYVFHTINKENYSASQSKDSVRHLSGRGDTVVAPLTTREINITDGSACYRDYAPAVEIPPDQDRMVNYCASEKNESGARPPHEFVAEQVDKMRKILSISRR